ncbi:MAG: BMP family ABC transporter substrate-binding protein [Chloroflexota bacterium]|nr:MAG: BMP family ABC transporter substrate-binding protein [Chloroflexota bacterium]
MTDWQRRLPFVLTTCGLLAVVAIDAVMGTPSTGQPSMSPRAGSLSGPVPRIGIVYDLDGRGSAGLNDLAWEGAKRAADEFDAELKEMTAAPNDTDADREQRLTELADANYYPIIAVGSTYAGPMARVAPRHPGMWFVLVDDATVDAPNVIGLQFNVEQGSFLVGAAAALTSKTGKIGFIGAVQVPLFQKFEAGFAAGAKAANPLVEVQVAYLSRPPDDAGSSDSATARGAALGMYNAGADVIFGAAGESGSGVIQAAAERGLWAIGVDIDQHRTSDPSVRGAILTSMLKRADVATYTITMEVANGVPKDGNNVFGLDRGGVGFATSGGFVDPIRAQLDAFAAMIASGTILVPTTP